jgi:hypothetical protein
VLRPTALPPHPTPARQAAAQQLPAHLHELHRLLRIHVLYQILRHGMTKQSVAGGVINKLLPLKPR